MFNIIPPLLIILGIAGLIYIFQYRQKKKEPIATEDLGIKKNIEGKTKGVVEKFYAIFNKQNYQKINEGVFSFTEKALVRSRIIILRIDRTIFKNLTKIRVKKNASEFNGKNQNSIISAFSEEKFLQNNTKTTDYALNSVQEEKRLLKKIKSNPEDLESFKNLARIYLWRKDFPSARWALLEAYRLDKGDNVVQDLLVELYGKKDGD
ncbi:MAG: hypothetical protein PHF45_01415 [Candidatus Pacebacteria bacterium]|nr:hypothetical protein [Candidatus Paceibacterota bacterium]